MLSIYRHIYLYAYLSHLTDVVNRNNDEALFNSLCHHWLSLDWKETDRIEWTNIERKRLKIENTRRKISNELSFDRKKKVARKILTKYIKISLYYVLKCVSTYQVIKPCENLSSGIAHILSNGIYSIRLSRQ